MIFRRSDGTLAEHQITRGRAANERVDSVATFTGSAFRVDKGGEGLLTFGPGIVSFTPTNFWNFDTNSPRISVTGWYQGAVLGVGEGRVAVFGKRGCSRPKWTAQARAIWNEHSEAKTESTFILNVLHWLSGLLDK